MENWRRNFAFTVALPPQSAEALRERASATGVDVGTYVARLVDHLANSMVREKESTMPERVMLDPAVCMHALNQKGSLEAACVAKIETGELRPVVSEEMFQIMRSSPVPKSHVDDLIKYLRAKGDVVEDAPEKFVHPEDGRASYLANLAIARSSDGITVISTDSYLTKLADVNDCLGRDFTTRFPSVRIVRPEVFLNEREGIRAEPDKGSLSPTLQRNQTHVLEVARRKEQAKRHDQNMTRSQVQDRNRGYER